jgi:translation elongation factor EF-Tu-like GTPase
MAARKKGRRKYGKAASKAVESAMRRRKRGTLKGGRGRRGAVKSRKQAIAIGLSEARKKGAKVPRKRTGRKRGGRKAGGRKRSS